jgi:hypothetical protein
VTAHPEIRIVRSKDVTRRRFGSIARSKDAIDWTVGAIAHPKIRIVRSKEAIDDSKDVIDWPVEVIVRADRVTRQAE